jgi:hypothetical protein
MEMQSENPMSSVENYSTLSSALTSRYYLDKHKSLLPLLISACTSTIRRRQRRTTLRPDRDRIIFHFLRFNSLPPSLVTTLDVARLRTDQSSAACYASHPSTGRHRFFRIMLTMKLTTIMLMLMMTIMMIHQNGSPLRVHHAHSLNMRVVDYY